MNSNALPPLVDHPSATTVPRPPDHAKRELYACLERIAASDHADTIFKNLKASGERQLALLNKEPLPPEQKISACVTGAPVPKGRPRAVKTKSGQTRVITPTRTRKWEAKVRDTVAKIMLARTQSPFKGPVRINLIVRRAARRGDLSNFVKAIEDALNRVAYEDDKQIVELKATMLDPDQYDGDAGVDIFIAPA